MKNKFTIRLMTVNAVIAALYTALTFTVPMLSFGAVQFRLSEVLTVLPVFYPPSVIGLTLGCFVSNLVGFFTGLNPIGLIDSFVGTPATLIAALLTYFIGKKLPRRWIYILAPLPPVIVNAAIIGAELTILFAPRAYWNAYWANFFWVGIGQMVICYGLGLLLMQMLYRKDIYKQIFRF